MRIQKGGAGGPDPPSLKNHKNIGFSSNTGPDPLKNRSYQASIQCWAIIGTQAKRHLMAFRWRADRNAINWRFAGGPIMARLKWYLDPSSPHPKKKVFKVGPPLTKLSWSAHEVWLKDTTDINNHNSCMTKHIFPSNIIFVTVIAWKLVE